MGIWQGYDCHRSGRRCWDICCWFFCAVLSWSVNICRQEAVGPRSSWQDEVRLQRGAVCLHTAQEWQAAWASGAILHQALLVQNISEMNIYKRDTKKESKLLVWSWTCEILWLFMRFYVSLYQFIVLQSQSVTSCSWRKFSLRKIQSCLAKQWSKMWGQQSRKWGRACVNSTAKVLRQWEMQAFGLDLRVGLLSPKTKKGLWLLSSGSPYLGLSHLTHQDTQQ